MEKITAYKWVNCLCVSLFFFFAIFQMSVFNTISDNLITDFSLHSAHLGLFSSAYFYMAALSLIPVGLLLDLYPAKKLILLVFALCILSIFLFCFYPSLYTAFVYRCLGGVGNTVAFLSCMKLSTHWFSKKHIALAMGVMITIGMLGGVVQPIFALAILSLGWMQALWIDLAMGMLFLFIILTFMEDNRNNPDSFIKMSFSEIKKSFLLTIKNLQNWLCGCFTALLNLPVVLLAALWGNLFLIQAHSIPKDKASLIISMIFVGMIIGSPFFGWISDKIFSRKKPMIVGSLASIVIILLIIYASNSNLVSWVTLFFLLGFFSSSQVISYTIMAESNPKNLVGITMSLISILIYFVAAISQSIFGKLLQMAQSEYTTLSLENYQFALWLLPIAFTISLLSVFFLKETLI